MIDAAAVRRGVGLFRLAERSVIRVSGADARRWLGGMISNDVSGLAPGAETSGCYATLLTPQGRILADLHVMARGDGDFWLETERAAVPGVIERLEKYVIADDVVLRDESDSIVRFALEGPEAPALLAAVAGAAPTLAPESWEHVRIDDSEVVAAAWTWSGEAGYQLFVAAADADAVAAALLAAGAVAADEVILEVLRVEAGTPRLGPDLDESVLPDEAGLERAISTTKGCYTGQEVVARIRSRGRVKYRLVGLAFEGDTLPEPGAAVMAEGASVGEVTSTALSPSAGAIALAYVRRPYEADGAEVSVGDRPARVTALPFVGS